MATSPARKTPQDRAPAQADVDAEKQVAFSEVEGHELLTPFSKVKGSDQARLMARLSRLGVTSSDAEDEGAEVDLADLDLDELADFIDYVSEKFALDSVAFDAFTSGQGGMERAMTLAMAYVGELGKDAA